MEVVQSEELGRTKRQGDVTGSLLNIVVLLVYVKRIIVKMRLVVKAGLILPSPKAAEGVIMKRVVMLSNAIVREVLEELISLVFCSAD